jgi:molybdenum cofactor cytidylyltransferase
MQDGSSAPSSKLLLPYNNTTLLQHSVNVLMAVPNSRLITITGCFHQQITEALSGQQLQLVYNERWQQGMGQSIQKGIQYMQQHVKEATSVLIAVCDQPGITAALVSNMLQLQTTTGKGIIACTYAGTTGTPVLFHQKYFAMLEQLTGQQGAKKIIQAELHDVATIPFPEGAIDIDTPEDYLKMRSRNTA